MLWLLGGAGLWRFLTPRAGRGKPAASLSVADEDVPMDGALVFPQRRCAVVRDSSGIHALDLTCTHLGCMVTATDRGFACPCHGSRFDRRGGVSSGPAERPLSELRLDQGGGVSRISWS